MASSNIKDIKRRIKSVESTMQITKAMELVASSKLRKAKERADNCKEYFHVMYDVICQTALESPSSIYTNPVNNDEISPLFIVIAGDRGLAGGFNNNVLKMAESRINQLGGKAMVLPIGKKAVEHFEKRSYTILEKFVGIAEHMSIYKAEKITDMIMELFNSGKINSIEIVFTNYVSPILQEPRNIILLPIPHVQEEKTTKFSSITEFEPSPEEVFSRLVPKYIAGMIYCTVVDSFASEQASRRSAMENATDNATEMIDNLSLVYNRARQSAITQEITEIVSGATSVE